MKISVVIPCHNAGERIRETLLSVLEQSRPPEEVIVIDDDSTDDSIEQVRSCGDSVVLLRTRSRNAAVARNLGIRHATGEWIAFQDAHDLWYPEHLAEATTILNFAPAVAYVANVDLLHPDGRRELQSYPPPFGEARCGLDHHKFIENYGKGYFFANQTKLIRRDRLLQIGLHDETLRWRHDIDLWLRVIHRQTWCFNPKITASYRLPEKDDISGDLVKTALFNLRVLLKNQPLYEGSVMNGLIHRAARRAVSTVFLEDAGGDERSVAAGLALPWLTRPERALVRLARYRPGLLRGSIKFRRWLRDFIPARQL